MSQAGRRPTNVPRGQFDFALQPITDQPFENALDRARNGERLTVEDAVALLTTGMESGEIDQSRKEAVLQAADQRRAEIVGEEVTFVVNLNNNVTTACNTGCLFCNFKDTAALFETDGPTNHGGFTKTPEESRQIVQEAAALGISEVCSVSGLHPALALNEEHLEILRANADDRTLNFKPPEAYRIDPGTYIEQIEAMAIDGLHVHSMTPEEAAHARRGTDWSYREVYDQLNDAGLDSAPGTAAEILVDEVRDVICPAKIDTAEWVAAMEGAAAAGLGLTATIMYGHVDNERHRAEHLRVIRDLQDRIDAITEFVPLSFIHQDTPLFKQGVIDNGATADEDELIIAVSRLFLDNIEHIQSSWVKYGDEQGLKMLNAGANDFMGTILSEEITKRAGGTFGEARSVTEYVEMIDAIGRIPVERSTDYTQFHRFDPADPPFGPMLGPYADGTPLL